MKRKPTIILEESQYFGGKAAEGTIHTLINNIPKHLTYAAGFTGLDAIRRFMLPSRFNFLIEINLDIIELWRNAVFNHNDISPSNLALLQQSFFLTDLPCFYQSDTFLYLDPPYHPETRTSNHKYPFELTPEQHIELLRKAKKLKCMVMISCYDHPLYRRLLKGWRKIQWEAVTRGGTMRTETIYMNYPEVPPHLLHDTRFLGDDRRTREVTKKRLATIHRKIDRLADSERGLLFDQLRSKHPIHFTIGNATEKIGTPDKYRLPSELTAVSG